MRKYLIPLLLLPVLLMAGCSKTPQVPEGAVLTQVIYDRGHGSQWGNQFHMNIKQDEICLASWLTPEYEALEAEHVPLPEETWQEIETMVLELLPEMEPVKEPGFWGRLFERVMPQALDGGEFHTLHLMWETEEEILTIEYHWTGSAGELELERFLEDLTKDIEITEKEN